MYTTYRVKTKKVILHTILLGVGGSIYTSHTLNHLKELSLDTQKAHKAALKSHAHSVLYADKSSTARRTLEKYSCSQGLGLELGPACCPPDSLVIPSPWWRRLMALFCSY